MCWLLKASGVVEVVSGGGGGGAKKKKEPSGCFSHCHDKTSSSFLPPEKALSKCSSYQGMRTIRVSARVPLVNYSLIHSQVFLFCPSCTAGQEGGRLRLSRPRPDTHFSPLLHCRCVFSCLQKETWQDKVGLEDKDVCVCVCASVRVSVCLGLNNS